MTAPAVNVAPPAFRFDSEPHAYFLGERRLPSVTEVLGATGMLPDYSNLDEYYRQRGSAVHAAIAIQLAGQEVDWDFPGADDVRPRVERARAWMGEVEFEPLFCERPLYHDIYHYAGTPDLFGLALFPDGKRGLVLADWKSGAIEPGHDVQVAGGYLPLLERMADRGEFGKSIKAEKVLGAQCCVVSLAPERPLVHWVPDVPLQRDVFRAALATLNWRAANMKGVASV